MTSGVFRRVVLGGVHDDQAAGHADLRRGEPDARRVVHGREHVVGEPAKLRVDALDRLCRLRRIGSGMVMMERMAI